MMPNTFKKISYDTWHKAAEKALKGGSVDNLTKNTYDGIAIHPLYHASINSNQPALPVGDWQINQAINHPNIEQAKKQIEQDLSQGVNALSLYSNQSLNAHGYGINLNQANLKTLLQNIHLDMINLRLETGHDQHKAATLITNYAPKTANLSLGIDPIGKLAQYGGFPNSEQVEKQQVQSALKTYNTTHILRADGRIPHNAGASEAQELNFILSTALTYLKWADDANLDLAKTAQKIEICTAASQNQFLTIAKTRAIRQLWAELLNALDIKQSPAHIFAQSSYRMATKFDPYVNILRTTLACFSAGLGGANQIALHPLSIALGLAPSADRRIARHIQTILISESGLSKVVDPSHGSAYIETLTTALTNKAWSLFQKVQKSDGLIPNLLNNTIQTAIAQTTLKRHKNLSTLKQPITGTSTFPDLDAAEHKCDPTPKQSITSTQYTIKTAPLTPIRDAKIFELLRTKTPIPPHLKPLAALYKTEEK